MCISIFHQTPIKRNIFVSPFLGISLPTVSPSVSGRPGFVLPATQLGKCTLFLKKKTFNFVQNSERAYENCFSQLHEACKLTWGDSKSWYESTGNFRLGPQFLILAVLTGRSKKASLTLSVYSLLPLCFHVARFVF